jgi:hypothetical protein
MNNYNGFPSYAESCASISTPDCESKSSNFLANYFGQDPYA